MGVLKFRLESPDLPARLPELRSAYFTGLDRTPNRTVIEIRGDLLTCSREGPESGRLHCPWLVRGFGAPVLSTATLSERAEPYQLAVELARGRLNDVRNQAEDWCQMGLVTPPEFDTLLRGALSAFSRAATSQTEPHAAAVLAQNALETSLQASRVLISAYTAQVLQRRLSFAPRLPTLLSLALEGDAKTLSKYSGTTLGFNSARLNCTWTRIAPTEGRFRWDEIDAQLAFCRSHKLTATAGPLIDLRTGGLPDWLWLWGGDYDQIIGLVEEVVRQAVARYRGKVAVWHLVSRPASSEILGLSEEEQVRLTARALQIARRADPEAQLVLDFDRPWAEWMASSSFQLGPLHLADSLARAELGLSGIGLELAPGYTAPGSLYRDLLDVSRLLDLYALVNLPIHVNLAIPSAFTPDPQADPNVQILTNQWPLPLTEAVQRTVAAEWIALAVAKPYVRSVHWLQTSDKPRHLYPHAGLLRADLTPKPLLDWIKPFRATYLD